MEESEAPPPQFDTLSVPASCYVEKPWFAHEPTRETIVEILEWVKATGKPHECRGHTHTKPPRGSRPRYVEEFDVPTFGHIADRVAPCPCCCPEKPKYKRGGKIAWFEDEKLIRMIGPRCFQTLSPEGHREAEAELRKRKNREKAIRYLADSLPRVRGLVAIANATRTVALAVERFQDDLLSAIAVKKMDLWGHISTGKAFVFRQDSEPVVNKEGSISYREVHRRVPYAGHSWPSHGQSRSHCVCPSVRRCSHRTSRHDSATRRC